MITQLDVELARCFNNEIREGNEKFTYIALLNFRVLPAELYTHCITRVLSDVSFGLNRDIHMHIESTIRLYIKNLMEH